MWTAIHETRQPDTGERYLRSHRWHPRTRLASQTQWETCEILDAEGLWGDGSWVRCHWFEARVTGPSGTYVAGKSPGFYCPDWVPEPEYAGKQLGALVGQLITEGWNQAGGQGANWWTLRFRRRVTAGKTAAP